MVRSPYSIFASTIGGLNALGEETVFAEQQRCSTYAQHHHHLKLDSPLGFQAQRVTMGIDTLIDLQMSIYLQRGHTGGCRNAPKKEIHPQSSFRALSTTGIGRLETYMEVQLI